MRESALIDLQANADGILLPIRAQPGGRKNELRPPVDGALKVVVTQVAEKGRANQAILGFLAKSLRLRKSQLELFRGDNARLKIVCVRGISIADLKSRIDEALGD